MRILLSSKNLLFILIIIIVCGFFGDRYYLFDLFSHFYLQFFVINSILLIWYIIKKHWITGALSVFIGIFLFFHLADADFSGIYNHGIVENPDIFYMNTEFLNKDIVEITDYITQVHPKQIALVELNKELFTRIKESGKFKYNYYYPDNALSFGFFTNEEVLEQKTYFSEGYPIGYFKTKEHIYYIVHPFPPLTEETYNSQKIFFNDLEGLLKNSNNFVVVGDFNSTAFSPVYNTYFGKYSDKIIYSWGVNTILTIPIDHVISDKTINVYPGYKLSSDHIPLLINF